MAYWFAKVDIKVIRDQELSNLDKVVYAVLCTHADSVGASIVRINTIAKEANCSDRSVKYSLKKLVEKGYLQIEHRFWEHSKLASLYSVWVDANKVDNLVDNLVDNGESVQVFAPPSELPCIPWCSELHTEQDPTHNEIPLNDKKNLDYEDFEIDL